MYLVAQLILIQIKHIYLTDTIIADIPNKRYVGCVE